MTHVLHVTILTIHKNRSRQICRHIWCLTLQTQWITHKKNTYQCKKKRAQTHILSAYDNQIAKWFAQRKLHEAWSEPTHKPRHIRLFQSFKAWLHKHLAIQNINIYTERAHPFFNVIGWKFWTHRFLLIGHFIQAKISFNCFCHKNTRCEKKTE